MTRIHSFDPIVGDVPKLLILGSMPGEESLRQNQYYAHPRNHFWKLIAQVCDEPCPDSYEARTDMLKRHGIALWDSVASCERAGSLDSDIKSARPNAIADLFADHPSIRAVAFNGRRAQTEFHRHHALPDGVVEIYVPSSSPVPRKGFSTLDEKWTIWRELRRFLA